MSKIRVDKRASAFHTYRWYRSAGYSKKESWQVVLQYYGW